MVKWKSPNEEASLIFCLVLRTNALCWAVLERYLKLLQKMRKYHIGELLTTTLRVQKVTVACRMWTFQVNFVLGICLLKCSDVLAEKFIFLIEIRAKKASNLPPGDHVTSRDNDVVLWTCCVTELIVSNALGENFLLSDCKHINVICMTKRPSKHDHEIGSHNKGLTWFLNLREIPHTVLKYCEGSKQTHVFLARHRRSSGILNSPYLFPTYGGFQREDPLTSSSRYLCKNRFFFYALTLSSPRGPPTEP